MGQNIGNYLNVVLLSVPVIVNFWAVCLSGFSLQNRRMKWKKENKTKLDGPDMDESPESNWDKSNWWSKDAHCDACVGKKSEEVSRDRWWRPVALRYNHKGKSWICFVRNSAPTHQPCPCQFLCLWTTCKPIGPCPLTCPWIVSSQSLFWTPVGCALGLC